jgi:acyl carrier protein
MTKSAIRDAIDRVLQQVQTASGRACPKLTDSTMPVGDLDEFDSLAACEAAVILEGELGCSFGADTPFLVGGKRKRARTIAEAVDRIQAVLAQSVAA